MEIISGNARYVCRFPTARAAEIYTGENRWYIDCIAISPFLHRIFHMKKKLKLKSTAISKDTTRSRHIAVPKGASMESAFADIARSGVTDILERARAASTQCDARQVHQLRVAIRRLRVARAVFGEEQVDLDDDLRMFQKELSAARELDVLLDETLSEVPNKLRYSPDARRLMAILEPRRKRAHEDVKALLGGALCADFLRRLEAWSQTINGSTKPSAPSAKAFAAAILSHRYKRARRLGRKIDGLDEAKLHKLRIRIKKLRYTVEFFAALWPEQKAKHYLSALKHLQGALGKAHDLTAARDLVDNLAPGIKAVADFAPISHWAGKRFHRDRKHIVKLWRDFEERAPFWG
jgi:triphosphatase